MIKKIFNPFIYIAGVRALVPGIVIIFSSSIIGYFSNTHFPDLISIKSGAGYPLQYHVVSNLINFAVIAMLMYTSGVLFSTSKIRLVDMLGTISMARFPYLLAALLGFSNSLRDFGQYLQWKLLKEGSPIEMDMGTTIIAIAVILLTLLLTIWFMILLFNAFSVSANLKGKKIVILFIANTIIATIVSSLLNRELIDII